MRMKCDTPILELLKLKRPLFSLEFFPPKDDDGVENLMKTARTLREIKPDFASVTYGAGGSTRQRTTEICRMLRKELGYTVMPHLTCVNATMGELLEVVDSFYEEGIRNIMSLRGDPPRGQTVFEPYKDGLRYGSDLVALIHKNYPDICLGVGGYPEKHPEASTLEDDLKNLKYKVNQGAHFVTTQLFFQNKFYFDFVERCRKIGITAPIIPGIMPVLSFKQIRRIAELSHADLPRELVARLEVVDENDSDATEKIGIEWALNQIKDLLKGGAPGVHLYILNRSRAALTLAKALAKK